MYRCMMMAVDTIFTNSQLIERIELMKNLYDIAVVVAEDGSTFVCTRAKLDTLLQQLD